MERGIASESSISLCGWDGKDLQWQFDCTWFAYSDKSYIDFSATSARSDYEKKYTLTTVYLQGYQSGNVLGIQYWFYYPFHDDPGLDPHPHDWWYFWIWYNTNTHRPEGVVYDLHHNLRAIWFNAARVHREGIHVYTYHDAGGHRVMYAQGADIDGYQAWYISTSRFWDVFEPPVPWTLQYGYPFNDINNNDAVFGLMIKGLYHKDPYSVPPWRGTPYIETFLWTSSYSVRGFWDAGVTLPVQAFPHWVWVYGVEPYNATHDRVEFTGDNIYTGPDGDLWSWRYYVKGYEIKTCLPWRSSISTHDSIPISSTEMVWWWRQYDPTPAEISAGHYTYGILGKPTIFTRYYDGSP